MRKIFFFAVWILGAVPLFLGTAICSVPYVAWLLWTGGSADWHPGKAWTSTTRRWARGGDA